MARSDGIQQNIIQQNGRKIFIGQVAVGGAAGVYNIPTNGAGQMICADGTVVPNDALLMIQPDQDMYYRPCANGAVAGAASNNSVRVVQYQQEFFHFRPANDGSPSSKTGGDGAIDCIAASTTGHANLFLVV